MLQEQQHYAEAGQEHRTVLGLREKVLGARHPDVFMSCFNLALCLEAESKNEEALVMMKRAHAGFKKSLGAAHPYTRYAEECLSRIEREGKKATESR